MLILEKYLTKTFWIIYQVSIWTWLIRKRFLKKAKVLLMDTVCVAVTIMRRFFCLIRQNKRVVQDVLNQLHSFVPNYVRLLRTWQLKLFANDTRCQYICVCVCVAWWYTVYFSKFWVCIEWTDNLLLVITGRSSFLY